MLHLNYMINALYLKQYFRHRNGHVLINQIASCRHSDENISTASILTFIKPIIVMKRTINNTFRMACISVIVLAFTSISCQNIPTGDSSISAKQSTSILAQTSMNNGKKDAPPGLTSNSVRYADNSMPAASGRDGAVTVTARAMIDVDGNTDLEVTTGDLSDISTAPGTFTKLQIKALDLETPDIDTPIWVDNQNRLNDGGYFSTTYSGLSRGQQLLVHSNVKGIIRGTAVVFMNEFIKARPDIHVSDVGANTDEAIVGEPVTISATISELNADLGATTSCVLYVDGELVDFANNVWIDAGDMVTCQFETTFETSGQKNIIVKAENVSPGDYDNSNNDAYFSLNVIEPTIGGANQFMWTSALFMSSDNYNERRRADGSFDIYESSNRLFYFGANKNNVTNFSMPQNITARVTFSDESKVEGTFPLEVTSNTPSNLQASLPYSYRVANNLLWLNLSTSYSADRLSVNMSFNTSRYVYYGRNYYQGDYYNANTYGPEIVLGDDISFSIQIGEHSTSGSYLVNSRNYENYYEYGPNDYQIYRSTSYNAFGSGQPEL